MNKKKPESEKPKQRPAAYEPLSSKVFRKVQKVNDLTLVQQEIDDIFQLIWFPLDASEEVRHARASQALELYESLEPADGAEGMLAKQMVGTHYAAKECLRRAALPNQSFEGRDMALKHAHKLMTLYSQQVATLDKHRGKGQQKVTVEHVNVEAGGQAIVGNVSASSKPAALSHQEMQVLNASPEKAEAHERKR